MSNLIACYIKCKLPTMEIIKVNIHEIDMIFVKDLKRFLYQKHSMLHPLRLKLIYNHQVLQDMTAMSELNLQENDMIEIILKTINVEPIFFTYNEFITSHYPSHLSINIPIDSKFHISFKHNLSHHQINFPSFLDYQHTLQTIYSGNMESTTSLSPGMNQSMGFVKWVNHRYSQKIFLLIVDEFLDTKLDRIRYDVHGVNVGYCEGDYHSWQRYTRQMPIECEITIPSMESPLPHIIEIKPCRSLLYDTPYALVLQNNIPTIPTNTHPINYDFMPSGIGEDKVIIFKTEKNRLEKTIK